MFLIKETNEADSDMLTTKDINQTDPWEGFSMTFGKDTFLETYRRLCNTKMMKITDNKNLLICSCVPDYRTALRLKFDMLPI